MLSIVVLLVGVAQAQDTCEIELALCHPQSGSGFYWRGTLIDPVQLEPEDTRNLLNKLAEEIKMAVQVAKTVLRGRLYDSASGPLPSFPFVLYDGARQIQLVTDSRGCFRVDGVLPGKYRASASRHRSFTRVSITESGCHSSRIVMEPWGLKEQVRESIEDAVSYGKTVFSFAREFIEESISSSTPRK